jgi:hypothetical protein
MKKKSTCRRLMLAISLISDASTADNDLELEMDEFNRNPCMPHLVNLVTFLNTSVTPPPAKESSPEGRIMPEWMQEIHRVLLDEGT